MPDYCSDENCSVCSTDQIPMTFKGTGVCSDTCKKTRDGVLPKKSENPELKPVVLSLYVAGPMRGYPNFNRAAFDRAARTLRDFGYAVFNPAEQDVKVYGEGVMTSEHGDLADVDYTGFSLGAALAEDLDFIARHADYVVVLDGWERSKGATAEVALALALDKPVVRFDDVLKKGGIYGLPHITELPGRFNGDVSNLAGPPVTEPERPACATEKKKLADGEVLTVSSTGGEKGAKLARFDLIPVGPLTQLAEHYGRGAAKYSDNQWRRGYEWSKSYGALQRHVNAFWNGEDFDAHHPDCPEDCNQHTGSHHLAAAAWHCLTLLEFAEQYPQFDDRYIHRQMQIVTDGLSA